MSFTIFQGVLFMKLGARVLKTGIAIVLALTLAQVLNLPTPVFAAIAAVFALQPTIFRSYNHIVEQVQGNLIGAITAVLFVWFLGNDYIFVGLAAIIVIALNLKLKLEKTISLSLVTMIVIMESTQDSFVTFALLRFSTIMLGVLSAFIVNLFFLPPKHEKRLYNLIEELVQETTRWLRLTIRHASQHKLLKNDIRKMQTTIRELDTLYGMFKEERSYLSFFKKETLTKSRKLVIYRQMISTARRSLETLRRIHRYENEFLQMPEEFQILIQQQLDILVHHHEHVMLKHLKKVKTHVVFEEGEVQLDRKALVQIFFQYIKEANIEDEAILTHNMQIISSIVDYEEQLEHLNRLINSFQRFHVKANKEK